MSPISYESGIGRRDFFCSGGSAIFGSLVAALLGGAKPARNQSPATYPRSTEPPFA
jgi:hypothetical protein